MKTKVVVFGSPDGRKNKNLLTEGNDNERKEEKLKLLRRKLRFIFPRAAGG